MRLNGIVNFIHQIDKLDAREISKRLGKLQSDKIGTKFEKHIGDNIFNNLSAEEIKLAHKHLTRGDIESAVKVLSSGKDIETLAKHLGVSTELIRTEFNTAITKVPQLKKDFLKIRVQELNRLEVSSKTKQILNSNNGNDFIHLLNDHDFITNFYKHFKPTSKTISSKITLGGVLSLTAVAAGGTGFLVTANKYRNDNTGCFLISNSTGLTCKLQNRSCLYPTAGYRCTNTDVNHCIDDSVTECKNCFCKTDFKPEGFECTDDLYVVCNAPSYAESIAEVTEGIFEKAETAVTATFNFLYNLYKWIPVVLLIFVVYVAYKMFKPEIKYGDGEYVKFTKSQ